MKHIKSRIGVTIVELLIYMGMFSILILMLTQVFASTLELRRESEAYSAVSQDLRYILSRFDYDIKRASSISTPATLGSQSSTLTLVIDSANHVYSLSNGNLVVNSVQLNNFDTTVSDLSFLRLGNSGGKHSLKISYTVTGRVLKGSGVESKTVTTTIGLR